MKYTNNIASILNLESKIFMEPTFFYDNVKIFGTNTRMVELQDLQVMSEPPESQLHILRHFSVIDEKTKSRLFAKKNFLTKRFSPTLSPEELTSLLDTAGSKFNPLLSDVDETLTHLFRFLEIAVKQGTTAPWIQYNSKPNKWYTEIAFTLTPAQKSQLGLPEGAYVGTKGIVIIDESNRPFVQKEARGSGEKSDQLMINIIKGPKPPLTDIVTINMCYEPEIFKTTVLSVYTSDGHFSPPFPDAKKQSQEEYEYNTQWWNKIAFFR